VAIFQPTSTRTEAQSTAAAQALATALRSTTLLVGAAASLSPHAATTDWVQLLHPTGYLVRAIRHPYPSPDSGVAGAPVGSGDREQRRMAALHPSLKPMRRVKP
jgi:hypothetical protein